ncbi:hypothetical protein C7534_12555 [Pseudomonas sp. OV226]|nr:hypothetical protein C7534_12555 [Pseudomonas sp. OV226]
MKHTVEEIIRQVLIDLTINHIYQVIEWIYTFPWQAWLA